MTLKEINDLLSLYSEPKQQLVLTLPLFVYSTDFKRLYNLYHKYYFRQYINTPFNDFDWKVLYNGMIVLIDERINKMYINGELYEGVIAYFDLYREIYRLQNSKITEIANILFNNNVDRGLFMNEFYAGYQRELDYMMY